MGALKELWWVSLMFGGPALIAVLWQKHTDRRQAKWDEEWAVWDEWKESRFFTKIEEFRSDFD
jgi:hypothetical protein